MPLHDVGVKYIADDATIQDTCIKRGGEGRGERGEKRPNYCKEGGSTTHHQGRIKPDLKLHSQRCLYMSSCKGDEPWGGRGSWSAMVF
jgi:hypothetical protein